MEGDLQLCLQMIYQLYNFNPLPPHGGRHIILLHSSGHQTISIHSLRMEGDIDVLMTYVDGIISIHSLRMEGDFNPNNIDPNQYTFQSTPSAWRETSMILWIRCYRYISIHSLRMEGDSISTRFAHFDNISIHSLRMEGDQLLLVSMLLHQHFNPLPPHGGRPVRPQDCTFHR